MKCRMRIGLTQLISAAAPMSIVPAMNPPGRIATKVDLRNPPPSEVIGVAALAHPDFVVEIVAVAALQH